MGEIHSVTHPDNNMGPISLILLISSPFLTLGTEPFTNYESVDTSVDNELDSNRVERSQSIYPGAFTAYNQPLPNTYQPTPTVYQPSAPVYQPAYQSSVPEYQSSAPVYSTYDTVPPYEETPAVIESSSDVILPEEIPVEVRTAPPATTTPAPTFEDLFGFNLAEKTREESERLTDIFTQLSQDKEVASIINANIESNTCVDSLEEMLGLIKRGASIIERAGPEMEQIYGTLNKLRNKRNVVPLVRGSADLLLQFETVFPKFETFSLFTRCQPSSNGGFQALRDQARILYRMSLFTDVKFPQQVKDNLLQSAIITEVVTNFLDHLQENLAKRDCFTGSDFLKEGTLLSAQVLDDMAEALGVLGYLPRAKETRQYSAFVKSIAASLGKLKDFKIDDDCSPGALGRAAENLNSLATLIEEVGQEELGVNLGLVFRVDLLP